MPGDWRRLLEQTGEPWYLLPEEQDSEPRIVNRTSSGTVETGNAVVNVVTRYGADDGPWLEVGTWDHGFSGSPPDLAMRERMGRDGVLDRLAFAVAGRPFAAESDAATDPVLGDRDGPGAWLRVELTIDAEPCAAFSRRCGKHEIAYTTAPGRCVFVHAYDRPLSTRIVSCRDLAALDASA